MVASKTEINTIMNILGQYFPDNMIESMLEEIWEEVGVTTSNDSLRDTISGMLNVVKVFWKTGDSHESEGDALAWKRSGANGK